MGKASEAGALGLQLIFPHTLLTGINFWLLINESSRDSVKYCRPGNIRRSLNFVLEPEGKFKTVATI